MTRGSFDSSLIVRDKGQTEDGSALKLGEGAMFFSQSGKLVLSHFAGERPNLFVYSPLLLPLPYMRVARWINRWLLMRALRRWMRATGFYRPIAWTFLPTPLALDLLRDLDPQLTIYYCIDDFASSSPAARARRCSRSSTSMSRPPSSSAASGGRSTRWRSGTTAAPSIAR